MSEADKIASLNIGSMETTADDRLSSDPAYLTSRVAELERELRLVRGVATQADATIDQLAKQRDAHMAEIIRAREIIERISGERAAHFRDGGMIETANFDSLLAKLLRDQDDQLLDARFIMGAVEAALWNEDATAVALERGRMREWMKRFDAESAS